MDCRLLRRPAQPTWYFFQLTIKLVGYRRAGLLFIGWISYHSLTGQQVRFDHLTVEQGLSQQSVSGILQDYEGFMWFATREGLNKYDGYTFRIYEKMI